MTYLIDDLSRPYGFFLYARRSDGHENLVGWFANHRDAKKIGERLIHRRKAVDFFISKAWVPNLAGKTIFAATANTNASGDDFVTIAFTDGTMFTVREESQSGYISVELKD